MVNTVAIDLGKRVSGFAWFFEGRLVFATEVRACRGTVNDMVKILLATAVGCGLGSSDSLWFAEKMINYRARNARRTRLNHLSRISEGLKAQGVSLREIPASRWKGSIPKEVERERVLDLLTEGERTCAVVLGKESISAMGIGLYVTGRAARGLVPKEVS